MTWLSPRTSRGLLPGPSRTGPARAHFTGRSSDGTTRFRVKGLPTGRQTGISAPLGMGLATDEGLLTPRTEIASLYIDQVHRRDIGRQVAHKYGIPLYKSIRRALTLGDDKLAVDQLSLTGPKTGVVASRSEPPCKPNRPQSAESVRVSGPKPGYRRQPTRPRALFAKWRAQQLRRLLGATLGGAQR